MLRTEALVVGYSHTPILGPLDLRLEPGEVVGLLGANGTGKSTLIRSLTGMQPALSGQVWIDGADLRAMSSIARAQKFAVVLTDRVQGGLMTGYDLVGLGRYPHVDWAGRLTAKDHAAVELAISQVGAEHLAHRLVAELSDGERQKIMVARALAQEPRLLVLDEVTAFLDLPRLPAGTRQGAAGVDAGGVPGRWGRTDLMQSFGRGAGVRWHRTGSERSSASRLNRGAGRRLAGRRVHRAQRSRLRTEHAVHRRPSNEPLR